MPVAIVAWILAITVAFASDWLKHRYWFAVGASGLVVAGFVVLMTTHSKLSAQYAGLFLAYSGTPPPLVLSRPLRCGGVDG